MSSPGITGYAQWGRELLDHAASQPDDGQPGHNLWQLTHEVAGRRLVAWGRADVPAGAVAAGAETENL